MNTIPNTNLQDLITTHAKEAHEAIPDISGALASIYQIVQVLDQEVSAETIPEHTAAFTTAGNAIFAFAGTFHSPSYDELRWTLTNLAINYLMLVLENQEGTDSHDLLALAYGYSTELRRWDESCPPSHRILGRLAWQNFTAPKHLCNVETARQKLEVVRKKQEKLKSKIDLNLSLADSKLSSLDMSIFQLQLLFEMDLGEEILWRRPDLKNAPSLDSARAWLATGKKHREEFDRQNINEATVNCSARVLTVCDLVEIQVKSALARGYVAYWEGCAAFKNFAVLAEQALAYAQQATGNNWDFYVPPALVRPEEPLLEAVDKEVSMLSNFAEASLSYALCLNAQMNVQPKRSLYPPMEPVRIAASERLPVIARELPEVIGSALSLPSQKAIGDYHRYFMGEELKENARNRLVLCPKKRLVGFEGQRGRGNKKRRRQAAHN
jgi:hypothetical protein